MTCKGFVLIFMLLVVACSPTVVAEQTLDSAVLFSQTLMEEQPEADVYRIGFHTEVTGDGAQIGDLGIRAAKLAIEEINAAGGVNGRYLSLIIRDVQSDANTSLEEYRASIIEDNLFALLGPFKSAYAVDIIPEHNDDKLPMFIGASSWELARQEDRNLLRMRPSDEVTAAAIVAFAVDQLEAEQIAIIHDNDALGVSGAERVRSALAERNISAVDTIGYNTASSNFTQLIGRLVGTSADTLVLYGTNGTDIGRILRQLRFQGVSLNIITSPSGGTVPVYNMVGNAQDGVYVITDALLDLTENGRLFAQAFNTRYGFQPDTSSAWTYDALHLLAKVMRTHPTATPEELSYLIKRTPFIGVQGQYNFHTNGNGLHNVAIVEMRAGEPQLVGFFNSGIDNDSIRLVDWDGS